MHYYLFNIGDYKSHTDHLELLEDLAYRRMLDWCYLHESPLPEDVNEIAKKICMRSHSDCIAFVLQEFFTLKKGGWQQDRIKKEVDAYHSKSEKAKASAKARWDKKPNKNKKKGNDANALRPDCERNAKQETINSKQEPLNIYTEQARDCLEHLNIVTGRKFKTDKEVKARLKDYSANEIKTVIDYKAKEWMGKDMQKYLRPETLFNKTKFEGYLNDAKQGIQSENTTRPTNEPTYQAGELYQAALAKLS